MAEESLIEEHINNGEEIPQAPRSLLFDKSSHELRVRGMCSEERKEYNSLLFFWTQVVEEKAMSATGHISALSFDPNFAEDLISPPPDLKLPEVRKELSRIPGFVCLLNRYPDPFRFEQEVNETGFFQPAAKMPKKPEEFLRSQLSEWMDKQEIRVSAQVHHNLKEAQAQLRAGPGRGAWDDILEEDGFFQKQDYTMEDALSKRSFSTYLNLTLLKKPNERFHDYYLSDLFHPGILHNYLEEFNDRRKERVICLEYEKINDIDQPPFLFCPKNNYGFLLWDIYLKRFRFARDKGENMDLYMLRSMTSDGDAVHFPARKFDELIPPGTPFYPIRSTLEKQRKNDVERRKHLYAFVEEFLPPSDDLKFHSTLVLEIADKLLMDGLAIPASRKGLDFCDCIVKADGSQLPGRKSELINMWFSPKYAVSFFKGPRVRITEDGLEEDEE